MRVHTAPLFRRLLALALPFAAVACSAVGEPLADRAAEINATLDVSKFQVRVGDTIDVRFPFAADLNHTARVQKDGSAVFLILDRVAVEGLTVEQLDAKLLSLYKEKGQDKDLTVSVAAGTAGAGAAEQNGQAIYVIGEVHTPGPVTWQRRRFTLFEAIGEAGGLLKASANPRNVALVRRMAEGGEVRTWFLDADPYGWGGSPAIYLQPTDIVIVPNTAIDEANIWVDKYIRQMLPFPYLIPPTGV
ncbi:MAG: hypothetical protein RL398_3002 [Planctomycetota bacterium]|jgi:protein involved in polysaccharide export with SLBB domain